MEKEKGGLSVQTLVISALASVAAAVVVPLFWEKGTLLATAMTPVIVALVSEGLRKPAQKITAVTPLVTRRSATGAAVRSPERYEPDERFDPLPASERAGAPEVSPDDPYGLRASPRVTRHWKLALVTGVVAFVIGVVALTGSELVLGGPATKDGGGTTFFGGGDREPKPQPTATPTATPDNSGQATPTPTPTATPTVGATPTPTPSATPAPSATPTATP